MTNIEEWRIEVKEIQTKALDIIKRLESERQIALASKHEEDTGWIDIEIKRVEETYQGCVKLLEQWKGASSFLSTRSNGKVETTHTRKEPRYLTP